MMVQRTLAAKNLSHAQGGVVFAGFLKTLPVFLLIFPGMISRIKYIGLCLFTRKWMEHSQILHCSSLLFYILYKIEGIF